MYVCMYVCMIGGDSSIDRCRTPGAQAYRQLASEDYRFRIEKARERYTFNQVGRYVDR